MRSVKGVTWNTGGMDLKLEKAFLEILEIMEAEGSKDTETIGLGECVNKINTLSDNLKLAALRSDSSH